MARTLTSTSRPVTGRRSKTVKRLKIGCTTFLMLGTILVVTGTIYAKKQLDAAAKIIPSLPEKMKAFSSERTVILAKNGRVMESISTEFRLPVKLKDIPARVKYATLAAEDKRFYDHQGVDYWAVGRAAVSTMTGRRTEGASTIPMQIAKRLYTSNAKTLDRKVQDMALATMIERQLTKDQILELYLNQIYYGSGAYGISAAAEVYFDKSLDKLTIAEAATLARCVRRPSDENPFVAEKTSLRNRDIVLRVMRDEGWIKESEYRSALQEPLKLAKAKSGSDNRRIAPYFCDYVKAWVKENLPDIDLTKGGITIETTLDPELQAYAERKVREMVAKNRRLNITTSAFALFDNEGRILAMVGGPDYDKNQYNVITQGHRQPGSAFKPIVYATAFEVGALSPYGSVSNEPFQIKDDRGRLRYTKGGGKGGSVSVRTAIASSINTPAMWAGKEAGIENVVQFAHTAFGIKSELPVVDSLPLGAGEVTPMELATAYSLFQNGGDRFNPFAVVAVLGPDGIPIRTNAPTFDRHQISAASAEGMDMCLRAVVTGGTGRAAGSVTNARGKTGTTSENKDAWFCGYTDKFLGVGWVANEVHDKSGRVSYQPMASYVMGGHMVAPMGRDIVKHAQQVRGEDSRRMTREHVEVPVEETPPPVEENPGINEDASPEIDVPTDTAPDLPEGTSTPDAVPDEASGAGNVPKPTGTKPPVKDKPDEGVSKVVFVEICADTGLRATIYCPERVQRAYRAGNEPKKRCTLHHRTNGE